MDDEKHVILREYFEGKGMIILLGVASLVYLLLNSFIKIPYVERIVPPLGFFYYLGLGVLVVIYQLFTWYKFGIFEADFNAYLPLTPPPTHLLFLAISLATYREAFLNLLQKGDHIADSPAANFAT